MSGIDPTAGNGDVLAALRDGRIQGDRKRLQASAQLMEGMFYEQLFKAMRDTVPEGGVISGGQGQEMFEGMLDERIAEAAAMGSERGLGRALYQHFAQHVAPDPTETETPTPEAEAPAPAATDAREDQS